MSLVRHAKSPYWYMSFMIDGKTVFRSTKTTNKALAQKIENEARKKILDGLHFERKDGITLQELVDEYLLKRSDMRTYRLDKVYANKVLGHKYCPRTRNITEVFGFDPSMMFHDLKNRDLYRLMLARKSEGVCTATFLHELTFINGLYSTAQQLGYQLPDMDITQFKKDQKLKPPKGKLRYLSKDEETRLLKELHPDTPVKGLAQPGKQKAAPRKARQDVYDLTVVLLDTGARHTEIASLKWTAIDLDAGIIDLYRSKVNNESRLPMTARVKDILARRYKDRGDSEFIFENKQGNRVRNYSPRAFKAACVRAGIEGVTFHTLRHTTASRLAQANVSLQDIALLLGHTTVAMTQKYSHLQPSQSMNRMIGVLNK